MSMEREAWLIFLHQIIAALNEGAPSAVLIAQALDGATRLLHADEAMLCTFEEGTPQALLWCPGHGALVPLGLWSQSPLLEALRRQAGPQVGPLPPDRPEVLHAFARVAAVPLPAEQRVLGALLLLRQTEREFQTEEVALLEPLAGLLGIALGRLGPLSAQRLTSFAAVMDKTAPARLLLAYTIAQLAARTGAEAGLLLLLTEGEKAPDLVCQTGLSADQEARLRRSLRRRHSRELARRGPFAPEKAPFALWSELGARGTLIAPLWQRAHLQGALVLALPGPPPPGGEIWKETERAAEALGLVLQMQEDLRQAHRRLDESEALLRVTQTLARPVQAEEMLNAIIQTAVENVPAADAGVIHLLTDGDSLEPVGAFRPFLSPSERVCLCLGVGLAGEALQQGQTLCVDDVTRDPRFVPGNSPPPYRSLLVAPMEVGGRKVGTLSLLSSRVAAYAPDDARFLTILAGQAAKVVENERLLGELHRRLEELDRAHTFLVRSEKLAATGRLAAGIAHEINNPLEGIKNFLAVLAHRLPHDDPNQELVRLLEAGFERIRNTVRQLLSFSGREEAGRHPCDLREVLANALGMMRSRLLAEHIQAEVDMPADLPPVMGAPQQLEQVFLNLFLNAADAMAEHGGTLAVRAWAANDRVHVTVRDTGVGIPAEILDHLFEPFVTHKRNGTGLGLWSSYGIISEHGGTIDVKSERDRGTTFTVVLPALRPSGTGGAR